MFERPDSLDDYYALNALIFSRGLATLEPAMSVCLSFGLSVGLSVTKTKCEHFLATPLLPTRLRLGGVYTALFL